MLWIPLPTGPADLLYAFWVDSTSLPVLWLVIQYS
jgi:hypothetical protein